MNYYKGKGKMMKNTQQGVALIMVMVFLLLMTLISATAIQQNTLQFAMIGNTQEQSQAFSSAENILNAVEPAIDTNRWSVIRTGNIAGAGNDNWKCQNAMGSYSLIAPGTTFNLGSYTAVVQSWWCENNPDTTLDAIGAIDQNGDGIIDAVDAGYGRPASCVMNEVCPIIPTNGFAPYKAGVANKGIDFSAIGCGTELYTIRVTVAQQNASGAERVVESKYAVRCERPE